MLGQPFKEVSATGQYSFTLAVPFRCQGHVEYHCERQHLLVNMYLQDLPMDIIWFWSLKDLTSCSERWMGGLKVNPPTY